ncbi:hypothetical protein IMY05_016G0133500 [Salix suchowensis]|nr:hypothetical protein IMY05_016G0133500 [Salix suchowensis]
MAPQSRRGHCFDFKFTTGSMTFKYMLPVLLYRRPIFCRWVIIIIIIIIIINNNYLFGSYLSPFLSYLGKTRAAENDLKFKSSPTFPSEKLNFLIIYLYTQNLSVCRFDSFHSQFIEDGELEI